MYCLGAPAPRLTIQVRKAGTTLEGFSLVISQVARCSYSGIIHVDTE